jgi:sortase A
MEKPNIVTRRLELKSAGANGGAPRRYGQFFKWLERVLLCLGLALLAVYGAARFERSVRYRSALQQFANLQVQNAAAGESLQESIESEPEGDAPLDWHPQAIDLSAFGRQRLTAYRKAERAKADAPLAVLRIPKVRLEAPVFEGTDELTLNHGVGRIAGTAQLGAPGNLGIAGHRDGFFRGLKDVRDGDEIELQTLRGTQTYFVEQIQIVPPGNVEVLQPRAVPSLTLVTCYPFYFVGSAPQRYIVTASLLQEKEADREIRNSARHQQHAVEQEKP